MESETRSPDVLLTARNYMQVSPVMGLFLKQGLAHDSPKALKAFSQSINVDARFLLFISMTLRTSPSAASAISLMPVLPVCRFMCRERLVSPLVF